MSEVVDSTRAGKRAMLRRMGVDVWLTRTGVREPSARPAAAKTSGLAADNQTARKNAASKNAASKKAASRMSPSPDVTSTAEPAVAPFSVACLSKGQVLMLVELGRSKAASRFALDVLAASSGQFGGEAVQLAFDWPQPGVDNNAGSARKALGAFVAKQLGDRAPALVLVGREVANRLEQVPDGSILLAPLAELMVDGDKKRALWAELEGRQ